MVKINDGTCFKTWVRPLMGGQVTRWHQQRRRCLSLVENRLSLRELTIRMWFMCWIRVSAAFHFVFHLFLDMGCHIEHIKYPDDNRPPANAAVPPGSQNTLRRPSVTNQNQPQQQPPGPPAPAPLPGLLNGRAMSPPGVIPDRTMSPVGRLNGTGTPQPQAFASAAAAAVAASGLNGRPPPVRPRREDDLDDDDAGTSESFQRARSPSTRAISPASVPQTQSIIMTAAAAVTGRQSPVVTALPPSVTANMAITGRGSPLTVTGRSSPVVGPRMNGGDGQGVSPVINGYARPSSRTGHHVHHQHNGSLSNNVAVTADVMRDYKAKEVELDSVKRQTAWMREALAKAVKAGFATPSGEGVEGLGPGEEGQDAKQTELVLRFKQFKAQTQVSCFVTKLNVLCIYCHTIRMRCCSRRNKLLSVSQKLNVPKGARCKRQLIIVPNLL